MARVHLQGLAKRYGDTVAVEGLDLTVEQGELVAFLGPSGCGKTTTLRMIAGFVKATSGKILFDDHDVTYKPPHRRNTGLVFQSYALFPHLSVFENVAYGLRMRRVKDADIQTRVQDAMERVRISEFAQRLPKQLSGGQQQRVALARALVIEPDVLLLDEPLSNLDAKLRSEVRIEIRGIQQALGLTTLFVTHDQEEAMSIADRLVVMSRGRVEQVGTPRDLYHRPRSRFVADFIGRSSFLQGRMEGSVFVTDAGARIGVAKSDIGKSDAKLLGVRPEHIQIVRNDGDGYGTSLSGTVEHMTYLGPSIELAVRTDCGQRMLVEQPAEAEHSSVDLQAGERIRMTWPDHASMLLDD